MPKIVDHAERQREIGAAAEAALLEDGWGAVTLRGVGVRAGWSTGALRHYFPTVVELRVYVAARLAETLTRDVAARIAQQSADGDVIDRVARIVEQLLPFDDRRRREYALWSALVEWERDRPAGEHSAIWDEQRGLYRRCIAALTGASGSDHPLTERQESWAAYLHAVVDGLAAQVMTTPDRTPPAQARRLLRAFLVEARSTGVGGDTGVLGGENPA